MPGNIGVDGHRKNKVVMFSVEIVEMITPQVFHVPGVDPSVRVGSFLYEHLRSTCCQDDADLSGYHGKYHPPWEANRRDTNSKESRLGLFQCPFAAVSSNAQPSYHSQSWSMNPQNGASTGDNRDERKSDLPRLVKSGAERYQVELTIFNAYRSSAAIPLDRKPIG